jgi:16S rRNA (cytosine967-C5)-methyltransferase
MIRIKNPQDITQLAGFAQGLFTVQDITASQAVRLSWVHLRGDGGGQSPLYILDLCAAPGTKTTQLAELTADSAKIVATDIDNQRLEKIKENIDRLGIKNVGTVEYKKLTKNPNFDAVLLDVPCSNTGVLARRVESRYRLRKNTIANLAKIQKDLLQKAAVLIKPGGKICYSTCSIQKAENTSLVGQFLQHNSDFKLEFEKVILPAAERFDHDGTYVAIIRNR